METEDDNKAFTSVSTGHAVSVRQTLPPRIRNKHLIYPAITTCRHHHISVMELGHLLTRSRIQKSLQRSAIIPSASWEIVFYYPG
jgi:hypothetical protein